MIRNATLADIDQIKKVKPGITDEQIVERIKRQGEKLLEFLVLVDSDEIVSFTLLKLYGKKTHPDYPDIEDLNTREDKRAQGYASQMLAECEQKAKNKGFTKIGLAANPELNENARRLYEKLGYHHDGGKPYVDGIYNGIEDWVVDLEKEL